MACFIETDRGLVNLDHVVRITNRKVNRWRAPKAVDRAVLWAADDTELGVAIFLDASEVAEKSQTVIPAAPGAEALVFFVCEPKDGARPAIEDVLVSREPVVAWRLDSYDGRPSPVLIDPPPLTCAWVGIPLPDGRVTLPYSCICASLDEARAYVLEEEQYKWEERHEAAAA
jgi:hypothetical protein